MKKKQDYEQFLREKEMVDAIVQKINLENERYQTLIRDARTRLEKRHETKLFIEQFMKDRDNWKEQERRRQQEENDKIAEYARLQKLREDNAATKKKLEAAGKDAIYDKVQSNLMVVGS